MKYSDWSRSLSVRTRWLWYKTNLNRFANSRFSTLSRFTWFLWFSKCLCLRMRDLLADSRFDIIRLRFRSLVTGWTGTSEPEFEMVWVFSGSSEPDDVVVVTTGFGISSMGEKKSEQSGQAGKSVSKAENGF
ncbi:hypothetical protein ACFE04_000421 [Oxalis oulophora]